jgi:hypothetical protein
VPEQGENPPAPSPLREVHHNEPVEDEEDRRTIRGTDVDVEPMDLHDAESESEAESELESAESEEDTEAKESTTPKANGHAQTNGHVMLVKKRDKEQPLVITVQPASPAPVVR